MRPAVLKFFSLFLVLAVSLSSAAYAQDNQEEVAPGEVPTEGKYKIPLEPFNFSLLDRGRVIGQVDLRLVLELEDGRDYEDISMQIPRIRSDISIALTDLAKKQFSIDRPINPDIVSTYLTYFLDHRLGKDRVEVYVQQALIEPK